MIDANGQKITKEDRDKNAKNNALFKQIDNLLSEIGLKLSYGFISDNRLHCGIESVTGDRYRCPKIYVDDFKDDHKHANIRFIPYHVMPDHSGWIDTPAQANDILRQLEKQVTVYTTLCKMDFSGLYSIYEKTDPTMENGKFYFSNNGHESAEIVPVIEFLKEYYCIDDVHGIGYKSDDRIIVITNDLKYRETHFAPAYYDLHIFEKNKEPQTRKHIITGNSYSDFFIDDILQDDGNKIEFCIRYCDSGGLSKCTDTYYAYGMIDANGYVTIKPFIFQERTSEKGYSDPLEGEKQHGRYQYIVTGKELTKEQVIEYSKHYGAELELENEEREI